MTTDETRKLATPFTGDELSLMFKTLDAEPDDFATWSTSYLGARRLRATIDALKDRCARWNYDMVRAKDFTQIIYLASDPKSKDPFYCGRADRHDPDEGVEGGWWDDSMSDYVAPVAWMPYPMPASIRTAIAAEGDA